LGTPEAPTAKAVRQYLAEFLSDPRVVELPRPLWWLILHGFVLPTRPRRAAEAYGKIWTAQGSPLLAISRNQASALQKALDQRLSGPIRVALAMRYGHPSIAAGLEQLRLINARRLLILPLYPQYSSATTGSALDAVTGILKTWRWWPEIRTVLDYHDDEGYLQALVSQIQTAWATQGQPERLLFSFHGLPKAVVLAGDPYFHQCQRTAALVAERLSLDAAGWRLAFQSRFGWKEWLGPYVDQVLLDWGKARVASLNVVCPGFSADCLETLEEIEIRGRHTFIEAGGGRFDYIPALNDCPRHIGALADLVMRHTQGWPEGRPIEPRL
jgi:ferrochelatase